MKKKIIISVILSIIVGNAITAQAHDFEVHLSYDNVLFVNILDSLQCTAEITFAGQYCRPDDVRANGLISIPEKVLHNGKIYRIVKIGEKAFCSGVNLESVILPSSVKSIGEFAFEDCTSLKSIVFPGSQVKIDENAFWGCTSIKDITLGSDWTDVNFEWFKWSTVLTEIEISAKVRNIQHIRAVKSLENINVDVNNNTFSSNDGILYSADGSELFACPVSHKKDVIIPDGTESILDGAFLECKNVRYIEVPSSITSLSFMDFAQITSLESLVLNSSEPYMTALYNGTEVFALILASSAKLYVPKESYKKYLTAVCSFSGTYESLYWEDEIRCNEDELVTKKRILKKSKI